MNVNFEPLEFEDLEQLYRWFQTPEVKKWYAKGIDFSREEIRTKYLPRIEGKENIPSYIVSFKGNRIGFIQYYGLNNFLPEGISEYSHPLFSKHVPEEIAGIDLFIGDGAYLDKGIGSAIITEFLMKMVFPKYKMAVVDPELENLRAIKAYEKAGFSRFSIEQSDKYDQSIQLMVCLRD